MLLDEHGQPRPFPTLAEQHAAVDVLVCVALIGGGSLSRTVLDDLATLPLDAGRRVGSLLLALALAAMQDPSAWAGLLIEHLSIARKALARLGDEDAAHEARH